ncbi:MAG TPA: hypothetical protein VN364_04140 [Bellilinea sp.]|nr:hypothetical protein [Bellilinea sp.]
MITAGSSRLNAARVLIGLVLFFNLQAAILFILNPAAYAAGFEVSGVAGEKIVQGMGILFLMWNVPYVFALVHPVRYRTSLIQAVIMQAIGVIGETVLRLTLTPGHQALETTANRFILFDAAGLLVLLAAAWITRSRR